ncbi:MAG: hypothetical protein MSC31_17555 [Solirubrobacteraceae bacterium MAG38_C4-C5]|nr:hypothetical protein [Candidatus Siliceabacter maunaloa]
MPLEGLNVVQINNFGLKNHDAALLRANTASSIEVTLTDLEALRVTRQPLPASKYGLESICGASCETSAL